MPDSGPALDGGVTDDAGSADAGAVTTDSGVGSVDARGDAGPARDVGPVDAAGGGFDAGESPDTGLGGASGGSCGCRVGGSPTNTRAMMLLAAVALGLVARRRRAR
jgi:MYXO-CTERM domain-containing protein